MTEPDIELCGASPDLHRLKMREWLMAPHVSRWWGDPADNLRMFEATPDGNHAIIAHAGKPVGYMRWETVDPQALRAVGIDDIPDGSIDGDLFIGEEGLTGLGIGPRAVELLCGHLRAATPAPLVGFCTSVENTPAHAAFVKAGCSNMTTYDDPVFGPCHVFVRWLR